MSTTPASSNGTFIWREIMTPDVAASKRFYGEVFGWNFEDMPMDGFTYTIIKNGETGVGSIASLDALTRLRMQDLVEGLYLSRRPAVLLVTHDVAEAVRLADRVLLLEGGRIVRDEVVGLPRPRSGRSERELALAASLLVALGASRR